MASIHFESTYDNSKLIKGITQDNQTVGQWARNIQSNTAGVEQSINRITTAAGAYFTLDFAGRVSKEIISVRGEFQQLGIAFETMLGSREKADKLMAEQIKLSQKTPYTLTDVATNTKQLLAMGIGYEKVMQTMKDLGNVAAGVSVPLSRVAINYGQVATLGVLQQREIRDFAMAGIPLIDELAKNMGKAKAEVLDMVSAGQIGFPAVEKAFQTMSGEGGKFYNLMEKQNASVTGQISNLKDKLQVAANEIGKSNEGLIYGGIEGLTSLITNYEEVGSIILGLATTYGVYKAAVMVVSAAESTRLSVIKAKKAALMEEFLLQDQQSVAAARAAIKEEAATARALSIEASKQAAAAKTVAAKETQLAATAQLAAAEEAFAAKSVASAGAVALAETTAANAARLSWNEFTGQRMGEYMKLYGGHSGAIKKIAEEWAVYKETGVSANVAVSAAEKESMAVKKAKAALDKANAALNKSITAEQVLNANIEAAAVKKAEAEKIAATQAAIIVEREQVVATTVATGAEIRAAQAKKLSAAAQSLLNATMLNNPYVLATVAIGALAFGTYKYLTYQTELEKASSKMSVELENERDKVNSLFSALKLSTQGSKEHEAAKKKLLDQYGQYISEQNKELRNLQDIKAAYDEVNKSIAENIAIKTQEELKNNISEEYNPKALKGRDKILAQLSGQAKSDVAFLLNEMIERFKVEGTGADKIQQEWQEFYKKLGTIDKEATKGLTARNIQGYFFDMLLPITDANKAIKEADNSFSKFIENSKKNETKEASPDLKTYEEQKKELEDQLKIEQKKYEDLKLANFDQLAEAKRKEIENLQELVNSTDSELFKNELSIAKAELAKIIEQGKNPLKAVSDQKAVVKEIEDRLEIKQSEINKQQKLEEGRLEGKKQLSEMELQLVQSLEQAKTNAIAEGIKKQKALAETSYREEILKIEKDKQDFLEALNKSKGYKITDPNYITTVPDDIQAAFDERKKYAAQKYDNDIVKINKDSADKIKAIWDSATDAFLSNVDKEKRSINAKYDNLIEQAKLLNLHQSDIDNINVQRNKEILQAENNAIVKLSPLYEKAFGDIDRYGSVALKNLKRQIDELIDSSQQINIDGKTMIQVSMPTGELDKDGKQIKKTVNMTIEEFAKFKSRLNDITNALNQNNPFTAVSNSFKDLIKAVKSGNKEDIGNAFTNFNTNAQEAIDSVKELADLIGGELSESINIISDLASGSLNIAAGIESGDPVAVVKGVAQVFKTIKAAASEYKNAQAEWTSALIDLQLDYNEALNEQIRLQKQATFFIEDNRQRAINAASAQSVAYENYMRVLNGQSLEKWLNYLNVKTGVKKTGLFGWGSANVYDSLLKQFPELINSAGELDTVLAKTLLSNEALWTKTNDGDKKLLETFVSYTDQLNENKETLDDALQSIVGAFASDLFNALTDAWDNGKDSFAAYKETVTNGLKDIAKQMLFNALFAQDMVQLQTEIYASYGKGPDGKTLLKLTDPRIDFNVTDDIQRYNDRTVGKVSDWNKGMQDIDNQFGSTSGSSTSKPSVTGIAAQATEETVSAMVGQMMGARVDIKTLVEIGTNNLDILTQGIQHWAKIEKNTNELYRLSSIENGINELTRVVKERL